MTSELVLDHTIGFNGSIPDSMFVHPNGESLVYVGGGCLVVNDLKKRSKQVFLRGHDNTLTCGAISYSGTYLASGQLGSNADVLVFDFETKKLKYRIAEHTSGIHDIAFSIDERFLCTIGDNRDLQMYIWDMQTGMVVARSAIPATTRVLWGTNVRDQEGNFTHIYRFVTLTATNFLYVWTLDPSTGALTSEKMKTGSHQREYRSFSWSSDRELLYCGSTSGDVSIFLVRNAVLKNVVQTCSGGVRSIMVGDDNEMYVGGGDGSLTLYEHDGKEYVDAKQSILAGPVCAMAPIVGSDTFITASSTGKIYLVTKTSFDFTEISDNHAGAINAVRFSPGMSSHFATASDDGSVRHWEMASFSVQGYWKFHSRPTCLDYSHPLIVAGYDDGYLRGFNVETGQVEKGATWSVNDAHRAGVSAVKISPNLKYLVSGGEKGEIRVWDIASREMISHLKEHTLKVTSLTIFDDNIHMLSCSRDRSFLSWDLQHEKRISSHTQRMGGVNQVALINGEGNVLTVGQEKKISIWDLRVPSPVEVFHPESGCESLCIAVSPDGKYFATGGDDATVFVWDTKSKKCIAQGTGHSGNINSLTFSGDSKSIVSVSLDSTICIWTLNA
mmetsp:Transcript_28816/g.56592  ORF Transcript_28816/g.56592 Transcript_28816/m.56592 type:complete len:613 (-) Transcript_28816:59-1897(-)